MRPEEKYIAMTHEFYNDAIRLLNRRDIYDAAEKAWGAVENARKAFLVAIGVPEAKASSVEFGVTFFVKVLRKLNRKDLVEKYYSLDYCLHIKGFYEVQIPPEILQEKIYEVGEWISQILELIDKVKNLDLSEAIKLMDESIKLKRKILQMSTEYHKMLQQVDVALSKALSLS